MFVMFMTNGADIATITIPMAQTSSISISENPLLRLFFGEIMRVIAPEQPGQKCLLATSYSVSLFIIGRSGKLTYVPQVTHGSNGSRGSEIAKGTPNCCRICPRVIKC